MIATVERVPRSSPERANQEIEKRMEANVAFYGTQGPEAIARRLEELDREWDIERLLEANAAGLTLLSFFMMLRKRRWMFVPAVVAGFLMQHAIQGWCPPLSLFRRWGVRTCHEIEAERYALKLLRGDFQDTPRRDQLQTGHAVQQVLAAVRR